MSRSSEFLWVIEHRTQMSQRSDYWSFSVAWKWKWCLEVEEGLSAQLEDMNNKMSQVGFLFNYLLFIIGINFKVSDYAKVCQGAIKN